jgi:hypothetical protein
MALLQKGQFSYFKIHTDDGEENGAERMHSYFKKIRILTS